MIIFDEPQKFSSQIFYRIIIVHVYFSGSTNFAIKCNILHIRRINLVSFLSSDILSVIPVSIEAY